MFRWLADELGGVAARIQMYWRILSRAFIAGMLIPLTYVPHLILVLVALVWWTPDLPEMQTLASTASASTTDTPAGTHQPLAMPMLGIFLGTIVLIVFSYQCHLSAGRRAPVLSYVRAGRWSLPSLAWLDATLPLGALIAGVLTYAYIGWLGTAPLFEAVEIASLKGYVRDHGFDVLIIQAAIVLFQALCGLLAVSAALDSDRDKSLFAAYFVRIILMGSALAASFVPVLVWVVEPLLQILAAKLAVTGGVPLYALLLIHGMWTCAATSFVAARLLRRRQSRLSYIRP